MYRSLAYRSAVPVMQWYLARAVLVDLFIHAVRATGAIISEAIHLLGVATCNYAYYIVLSSHIRTVMNTCIFEYSVYYGSQARNPLEY